MPRVWILAAACALGFVAWGDYVRLQRVEFVTRVAQEGAGADARSPTGYVDGKRWLIVPEHNNPTYQWIQETQLMLARGDWRVRRIDYENAPFGRDVHAASPYRWWLVAVAGADRAFSGRPLAMCLERAALLADPLLHLLLVAGAALYAARAFGGFAAAALGLGLAIVYPLAAAFLPGVANDFGLSQVCALWSVLPLAAGPLDRPRTTRRFALAGVAGGCALWLNATEALPVLAGIAGGGLLAAAARRLGPSPASPAGGFPLPWRAWALAGASTSLLAYLVEYFPGHMEPQLRVNYPLYGVAWLGLAELLGRASAWIATGRPFQRRREVLAWLAAAAAAASLPVALLRTADRAFLAGDLLSTRLTNLPDGVVAGDLAAWIGRDGLGAAAVATLLPVLLLAPAAWLVARPATDAARRAGVAVALGPALAALGLALFQLRWWSTFDALVLALAAASAAAAGPSRARWALSAPLAAALAAGVVALVPAPSSASSDFKFTRAEVEGLYERALAQWIADRAGPDGATVLVPPLRTSSFCFYGGLRGLGTQNWENREGLSAVFRIVNSTRPDETEALVNQRGVTHIVVPSWDTDLDDFARMGLKQPTDSFIYALHKTDGGIFNWLRPLPYSQPAIAGFNERSVLVLEVTDETDPATVRSRLVEYLAEMHQIDGAAYSSQGLLRYPANLGALVALAQVAKARNDAAGFARVFDSLVSNLASGSDRGLAWDRRVSLAVVLELGGREDLARAEVVRCVADADPGRIRSLTPGSLYHLMVLLRHFGLELPDAGLRALAVKLLPSELRERL